MSEKNLLDKLSRLVEKKNPNEEHLEKLRKVLHKLKKKQKKLQEQLADLPEDQRQEVARNIEIIKLQRTKGLEVFKSLRDEERRAE